MNKFAEISKFFKSEYSLNRDGLEELFSLFEIRAYKKGDLLITAQSKEKQLRFLNKGIVRFDEEKEILVEFKFRKRD